MEQTRPTNLLVLFSLHVFILIASLAAEESYFHQQEESRLLHMLNKNYDKDVRPVRNASDPIVIKLSLTLTQIFDMDEKNQVLTTNVWLDQEWHDELLTWNPEDFSGIEIIRIPCEKIWLPDIVLYNSADDYTRGYMHSKAMVRSDGNVFWPPPTKFRSTCPVDVTYFPFDDQTCKLKLGSWTYDGFQVDVTNRTHEVDLSNYLQNGEWELIEARIVRNVVYYSCCPEPFPDVTVTLVIRRKILYYLYNVVLPCMMMSALTLLVFCLPPDSGEKIALGITVLLAFSVFMLAIAEKMPETSESIPLIGIYLTAVMAITTISVIMTVVVLNFHHRGPIKQEPPTWIRRLVLEQMARCTCVKTKANKKPNVECREYDNTNSAAGKGDSHMPTAFHVRGDAMRLTIESLADDFKEMPEYSSTESVSNLNVSEYARQHQNKGDKPTGVRHPAAPSTHLQEEVLKALRYLLAKQELEDQGIRVVNEWRQIAVVVDRFLFWIFFLGTAISSACFLLIVPMGRRGFYW